MTTPDESHFDEELRRHLADFEAAPPPDAWQTLRDRLPAPPAKPGLGTRLRPFGAGVIVGALLWWGGNHWTTPTTADHAPNVPAQGMSVATNAASGGVAKHPTTAPSSTTTTTTITPTAAPIPAAPATVATAPAMTTTAPAMTTAAPATLPNVTTTIKAAPATVKVAPATVTAAPATVTAAPTTVTTVLAATTAAVHSNLDGSTVAGENSGSPLSPGVRHIVTLDTAIRHTLTATDATRDARLRALLAEQTAALAAIQHEVDSLKQALPETPPAVATLPKANPANPAPSSSSSDWHTLPAPHSPWSMVALLETTPHWSVLPTQGISADQEQTQASMAQSFQVQRQLGDRWRVRGGIGQASLQTQGRYTSEKSGERDYLDSVMTTKLDIYTGRDSTYIVHEDSVAINEPILNSSGQIIGFNTTWASTNDTIWSVIVSHDVLTTKQLVVTKRTETWRERHQQLLRPEYRFWTLPVSAQYLLVNHNRWSLGLSVGAQAVIFRGGSRPVWNGDEYVLQRVGPRDGPYRPVSFSVSTGLEAQYRLTPRLSILAAPTLRWWAVPAAKGPRSTARTLLPAAQLGISYGF